MENEFRKIVGKLHAMFHKKVSRDSATNAVHELPS